MTRNTTPVLPRGPRRPIVLCVDDEPRVLSSLRRAIGRQDYDVITTSDPREALQGVGEREVDVLVADQRMPGMTGTELLHRVREASPKTVRVMLTAYPDATIIARRVECLIQHLIPKPWDHDRLLRTIETLVHPRDPAAEDESELMERAMLGDRQAYGRLFRLYAPACWRVARLFLHSDASADDAMQEVFTRALERIGSYRRESPPKSWFYAVTLNYCRNQLRQDQGKAICATDAVLDVHRADPGDRDGVVARVLQDERARRLASAVSRLSPAQREAFVLHYLEGLPYGEIAQLTGTTNGGARVQAHRAKQLLRRLVKDEDAT